ncbi:gustatory receptor, partial [Homalodisca vitripennis]
MRTTTIHDSYERSTGTRYVWNLFEKYARPLLKYNQSGEDRGPLLQRALFMCQTFMRFPLKYTLQPSGTKKLEFFPAMFWWGLITTQLQIAFWSFKIYTIITNQCSFTLPYKESKTTLFTATVVAVSNIWVEVISFNSYSRKYSKFLDIFNTLNRIDGNLQLAAAAPVRGIGVKSTAIIAVSIATPLIVQAVRISKFLSMAYNHKTIIMNILSIVCFIIMHCGQTCMLIHFQPVTRCLTERFRIINTKIIQEVNNDIYRQSIQHRNPPHLRLNQDRNANDRINSLMIAYHLLCDAVGQANTFYSNLLLASIATKFVYITASLYLIFLHLIKKNVVGIIILPVLALSMTCYLCMIVSSSSDVTQAAQEMKPIISKLITNPNIRPGLRKQLNSFFFQLRRKHLEFPAGGFFQVNRQMLTSMAATVTTNLVILIQFQTQPHQ